MDAVAQCEQLARERGENERQSPWRIYFRKEFFTPWHNSQEDSISTQLIYRQILHGVWSGEYSFEKVRGHQRYQGPVTEPSDSLEKHHIPGQAWAVACREDPVEEYVGIWRSRRQTPGTGSWSASPRAPLWGVQLSPPSPAPISSSLGPQVCSGL